MSADRIARTRIVDGLVTPAFIHNGPTWFAVELPVYADGLIDCWELVDLALLRDRLRSGWRTRRRCAPRSASSSTTCRAKPPSPRR